MSSPSKMLHDEKIESLAQDYLRKGFEVIKEPGAALIPFDLGGYAPDLIATKEGFGLIIEVKTRASNVSVDKFQNIAQEVAMHEGWRFLLVTLDDIDSARIPTDSDELPTWSQLDSKLSQARTLIAEGAIEPAILYLWSIFEAALRKRALAQSIPVERLPVSTLLNHMYSQGEVSIDDFDTFREFMSKRNRLAHGANEAIDHDELALAFQAINRVMVEWSEPIAY